VAVGLTGMANLKPAPLHLTSALVAKLTGDRPAYGKGVVRIPLQGELVDQPKGSEESDV